MRINKILLLIITVAFVAPLSMAEEPAWSGFMSDYSQLEKIEDGTADYRYLADDWEKRMIENPGYHAIMVDQPEILLADDSPYKGAKPRHLEALAESDAREEEEETVGLHAGRAGGWRRSQCGAIRYRQEG
jgi:hypothetical protein